jgi:hypothetical protein
MANLKCSFRLFSMGATSLFFLIPEMIVFGLRNVSDNVEAQTAA